MNNFCTNCGTKLRKEDKFCTNCGTKIIKDDNFCIKCGTKLRKEDKFCTNCGTKIDKSDIKQNSLLKTLQDKIEKDNAIKGKEKEEISKKLKMIDEIFESEEIKSEIRKNKIGQTDVISIKTTVKNKFIRKRGNMSEREIKHLIKSELEKVSKERKVRITKQKEKEMTSKKIPENKNIRGGYCSLNCRHCYEEFFDSGGAIVGDLDSEGYTEYYCNLGHSISHGRFCDDYE